jgi:hypothetical protein
VLKGVLSSPAPPHAACCIPQCTDTPVCRLEHAALVSGQDVAFLGLCGMSVCSMSSLLGLLTGMVPVVAVLLLQAMSEAGFQHAAVRDAAAAEAPAADATAAGAGSSQTASRAGSLGGSMAEYVGLVSESAILRHLGLYADDMGAGDEQVLDEGMLGMPQSFRQHLGLDNSFDSSAGTETPLSSRSRVATPLLDSSGARDGGGGHQQQGRQQSVSTDAGPSEQQSRQTSLVKLPDIVLAREGLGRQGSSASSMGSVRSGFAAAADGRKSAAGGMSDDGATRSGSFALTTTASESSNAALLDVQGAVSGAVEGLPDALTRYKHAASLWEVDMNDLEMIKRIGEGSFGEVMVATYRGTKVSSCSRLTRLHYGMPCTVGFAVSAGLGAAARCTQPKKGKENWLCAPSCKCQAAIYSNIHWCWLLAAYVWCLVLIRAGCCEAAACLGSGCCEGTQRAVRSSRQP